MLRWPMTLDASAVRALTFDCYGTLIDWDAGVRAALAATPGLKGCDLERLVREREQAELPLLGGPFRPYGEILAESLRTAAAAQGRALTHAEVMTVVGSMARWPAFPDSGQVLRRLAARFPLSIVSNVETKTLRASQKLLGAPFVALVSAEEIESYKPAPKHWEVVLRRLRLTREGVLHVAASLHHDIRPARALGLRCVWINRRKEPVPEDLGDVPVYPDLAALSQALGCSG